MQSKTKAILGIDVDGTLIDSNEKIHPKDVALLQNFPGEIQPILTTGRSLHGAKGVLQQNGLFEDEPLPLPGVFMNGGAAYHAEEKLLIQHSFSPHTRQTLVELASKYPDASFSFFTLKDVYLVNPNPFARQISHLHHLEANEVGANELPEEMIKLMILDEAQTALANIKAETADWDVEGAYSLTYAYEINPPRVTKANTLQELLEEMGLNKLPIFAVGDGENDLSLFRISQMCFAPASAQPRILMRADHLIQREKDGLLGPVLEKIKLSLV
jgi:Cof subfamily protein (haloacid dehalogenase superfamily)